MGRTSDMRVAIIANPRAGRNSGLAVAQAAARELSAGGWRVETRPTTCPGDATHLAREAAGEGYDLVLACGGDGTLSQVITGLLDTGVPTGILPAGTGNDFARNLGLPRAPLAAARAALTGHPAPVDLLEVNDGRLWAVNVAGAGFDAAVAERMNRRRRLTGGALAYLTAVVQELARHRPTEMRVEVDGEVWEGRALLCACANSESYGAGMRIAPAARVDDGLLDVVVVQAMGRARFLWCLPRVFRGTHCALPEVLTWRAREVRVETETPLPVLVDGDVQTATPLHIRIAPARAQLWWPGD